MKRNAYSAVLSVIFNKCQLSQAGWYSVFKYVSSLIVSILILWIIERKILKTDYLSGEMRKL